MNDSGDNLKHNTTFDQCNQALLPSNLIQMTQREFATTQRMRVRKMILPNVKFVALLRLIILLLSCHTFPCLVDKPLYYMWHRGSKPVTCRFLLFLKNHILHCICFKILFTESKYLVSKWSYTSLIITIKKWKNRIKSLRFSCHRNPLQSSLHYSEIILGNKGVHSVSNKTNHIKIG